MKHALVLLLVSLAALLATHYLGLVLSGLVAVVAVLFGGGLATAGLYYLDLRREARTDQNRLGHKGKKLIP